MIMIKAVCSLRFFPEEKVQKICEFTIKKRFDGNPQFVRVYGCRDQRGIVGFRCSNDRAAECMDNLRFVSHLNHIRI